MKGIEIRKQRENKMMIVMKRKKKRFVLYRCSFM